jgi:uncharacterized protein (TIGR03067 family)
MTKDLEKLQGSWAIAELEMDGQSTAAPAEARIVIEGSRFTSTGMGSTYEGTLELDASAKPARIDMKFDKGPEKGNTNLGIYQWKGDSWKLCLATRGATRPTTFKSSAGSGIAVETLVRAQAASKARKGAPSKTTTPEPAGPPTEFEGEWQMISGVINGAAMDDATVKWVKRITRGNQTSVVAGPQTMLKVEFTYDPSTSPQTLEYLNLHGASKGKRQEGIYRFEGGVLTVCTSAPGGTRPNEFTSVAGDGRSLTVWKRL